MYKATKTDDGLWVVEDELGSVIEVCETRAQARSKIRELNAKSVPAPTAREQLGDAVVDSIDQMPSLAGVVIDEVTDVVELVEVADDVPEVESSATEEVANVDDILSAPKQLEQSALLADEQPKPIVKVIKVEKRETKASKVRARIALAKQNAEVQEVVIGWAVENLGMAKNLARVYVKGNWDRVPG